MATNQEHMRNSKPLFIYDRDGTLQSLLSYAWALTRKEEMSDIFHKDFIEQNFNEATALLPGMIDLVRFTASLGYNVLVSDGDPLGHCSNLRALQEYFQQWKFKGKDVIWGSSPEHLSKVSRVVAKGLVDYFRPSQIIVIGDSLDDYVLALHLSYFAKLSAKKNNHPAPSVITLLRKGPQHESALNCEVPLITAETSAQMKQIIQQLVANPNTPNVAALIAEHNRNPQR